MDELSREEVEAERDLYGPFTESLRDLVDAAIRTTVDDDEIRRAHAEIEAITERLRSAPMTDDVRRRPAHRRPRPGLGQRGGRPAQRDRAAADDRAGRAAACGPTSTWARRTKDRPGSVHGGVLALVLDQMLGEAAGAGGKPGHDRPPSPCSYRQRTPLGDLHRRGLDRAVDGIKTWARGEICGRRRGHGRGRGAVHPAEVGARGDRQQRREHALAALLRVTGCAADRRSRTGRDSAGLASADAALAGVGEPGLLGRDRLELGAPRLLEPRPRRSGAGGETRSAAPCVEPAAARRARRSAARWWSARTRPRPRNETAQCSTAVTRFLNPVM